MAPSHKFHLHNTPVIRSRVRGWKMDGQEEDVLPLRVNLQAVNCNAEMSLVFDGDCNSGGERAEGFIYNVTLATFASFSKGFYFVIRSRKHGFVLCPDDN